LGFVKCRELFDQLSDYQLNRKYSKYVVGGTSFFYSEVFEGK
jgi:hypothetical protein